MTIALIYVMTGAIGIIIATVLRIGIVRKSTGMLIVWIVFQIIKVGFIIVSFEIFKSERILKTCLLAWLVISSACCMTQIYFFLNDFNEPATWRVDSEWRTPTVNEMLGNVSPVSMTHKPFFPISDPSTPTTPNLMEDNEKQMK